MVSKQHGAYLINGQIPEDLAKRVLDVTASNQELTDARLIREGLREVLPDYE